ncbi:hypothetical protein J7L02_01150, partial [Candidatus Woesearchaeota archaeon]|nr:hypothetical protein [Candidatus Woesearchaeota archaeon]
YSCTPPPFSQNIAQLECPNASDCVFDNGSGARCYPVGSVIQTNWPGENFKIVCMGPQTVKVDCNPLCEEKTFNVWCPTKWDEDWFRWDTNDWWNDTLGRIDYGVCKYPTEQCYDIPDQTKCNYQITQPEYWTDLGCFLPNYGMIPPVNITNNTLISAGWNESCCAYTILGVDFYDYMPVIVY